MRRNGLLVIVGTVLVGLTLLWNTFAAGALPGPDDDWLVPLVESRLTWATELTDVGSNPISTPVPVVGDAGPGVDQLAPSRAADEPVITSTSHVKTREESAGANGRSGLDLERADLLRGGGVRFGIPHRGWSVTASASVPSTSDVTCVEVLGNSRLDMVEFLDGEGNVVASVDYWGQVFPQWCFDNRPDYVWSANHSLALPDGDCNPDSPDTGFVDIDGELWDYDAFGQPFRAPTGLIYLEASYMRLYADLDSFDDAGSSLWSLDNEGFLDELIADFTIGESPSGWDQRYWVLDSAQLAKASGRTLAIVFYQFGDLLAPYQVIWLDDIQITVCYQRGAFFAYLPLVYRQPAPELGPICIAREPDSLENPGSSTVDATCSSSFTALDQRDYYALDLRGAANIRLVLFDLPSGTNWDAMIYENVAGYPLACHIGTPGHAPKSADCTLNPSKNYFVLVNRGPQPTGGPYKMRVERR